MAAHTFLLAQLFDVRTIFFEHKTAKNGGFTCVFITTVRFRKSDFGGDAMASSSPEITITSTGPKKFSGGSWVNGRVGDFYFNALVFAEHASRPSCELGRSRISKLQVIQHGSAEWMMNFDRGWDLRPQCDEVARVVRVLSRDLANGVYGPVKPSLRQIKSYLQKCWWKARHGY